MNKEMEIQEMELIETGKATVIAALNDKGIISNEAAKDIIGRYTPIVMMQKVFWKDRNGEYIHDIVQNSYESTPFYFNNQKEQSGTSQNYPKSYVNANKNIDEEIKQAVADGNMDKFRELRKKQGAKMKGVR